MKAFITIILLFLNINSMIKTDVKCATGLERVEPINLSLEKEILRLMNIERGKEDLPPLVLKEELTYAARYHAKDMAVDNYTGHDSYDRKNGVLVKTCSFSTRIHRFYNKSGALAENVSAGRRTAKATIEGWMNSPGHRANILSSDKKYVGIGYYKNENSEYKHYAVQCFSS